MTCTILLSLIFQYYRKINGVKIIKPSRGVTLRWEVNISRRLQGNCFPHCIYLSPFSVYHVFPSRTASHLEFIVSNMTALGFFETSEAIYPPNCINTTIRIPHFPTNQYNVVSSYNLSNVKVKAVCGSYSTAALRHIVLLPE